MNKLGIKVFINDLEKKAGDFIDYYDVFNSIIKRRIINDIPNYYGFELIIYERKRSKQNIKRK